MAYAHSATERYRLHIDHHQLAIGFAPAKAACDRRPRGWKGAPEGLVHCSATRRQAKMLTLEELVQPNHYRTTTLRAAAHSSGSTSATCATFSYLLASPFTSFARLGVLLLAFSFHHGCSVHVASEVFSNYLHDTGCRFHEDVLELDCPRRQRPKAYRVSAIFLLDRRSDAVGRSCSDNKFKLVARAYLVSAPWQLRVVKEENARTTRCAEEAIIVFCRSDNALLARTLSSCHQQSCTWTNGTIDRRDGNLERDDIASGKGGARVLQRRQRQLEQGAGGAGEKRFDSALRCPLRVRLHRSNLALARFHLTDNRGHLGNVRDPRLTHIKPTLLDATCSTFFIGVHRADELDFAR
mmetsp:Transcript_5027/g.15304  ORF Transcript_5027/g.15304 Transcript_5027/m.15304 type:complete len:353 (-) Transcript_5027:1828-2886(-)